MNAFLAVFGGPLCGGLVFVLATVAEKWGRESRINKRPGNVKNRAQRTEFDSSAWTGR